MKFLLLFLLVASVGFAVYRISLIYRSVPSEERVREQPLPAGVDESLPPHAARSNEPLTARVSAILRMGGFLSEGIRATRY